MVVSNTHAMGAAPVGRSTHLWRVVTDGAFVDGRGPWPVEASLAHRDRWGYLWDASTLLLASRPFQGYNATIQSNIYARINMIPRKLALRNFMCYRSDVPTLDFEGITIACLSGENGAGKSALLDALTWALWGLSLIHI